MLLVYRAQFFICPVLLPALFFCGTAWASGIKTTTVIEETKDGGLQVSSKNEEITIPLEQGKQNQLIKINNSYSPPFDQGISDSMSSALEYRTVEADGYNRTMVERWKRTEAGSEQLLERITTHTWPWGLSFDHRVSEVVTETGFSGLSLPAKTVRDVAYESATEAYTESISENYLSTEAVSEVLMRRLTTRNFEGGNKLVVDQKYALNDSRGSFLKEQIETITYNVSEGLKSETVTKARAREEDELALVRRVLNIKRGNADIEETLVPAEAGGWQLARRKTTRREVYDPQVNQIWITAIPGVGCAAGPAHVPYLQ